MSFLLDTNAVIALQKLNASLLSRLTKHTPSEIYLSTIVAHELYFGIFRSRHVAKNLAAHKLLEFQLLDFSNDDGRCAAEIRAALAASGTPIGPFDVLIAGQALARGLVLVTHNRREFEPVDGLAVEDWEVGA